jgi:hypothetical protein
MKTENQHVRVILLLESRSDEPQEVDAWLDESPYTTCEATNVFQALEQVSDFTVREAPDIVFLHVDRIETNRQILEGLISTPGGGHCAEVLAFAHDPAFSGYLRGGDLDRLAQQLDRLIPAGSGAAGAA